MLSIKAIDKNFDGQQVLAAVSLELNGGEFFSILGPSGCGKSTLLRILGGFETPDQGEVRLGGQDITHLPPHLRPTNMVFQRYALFPHLNVAENVAFSLRIRKVADAERQRQVDEALALVAMEGLADRRVDTLSGGQQQRVALARAVINRPKVLLLDEPLSALDLKLRIRMQSELRSLQRRLGMTFVFVTHDQGEALAMSDRIAVMNRGRVEQVGSPEDIYERPETPFVATFLGSMNRLEGQCAGSAPGHPDFAWVDLAGGAKVMAHLPHGRGVCMPGTPVQVMIRPEKVRMIRTPDTQATADHGDQFKVNKIAGSLTDIGYRGATVELSARCPTLTGLVAATQLNSERATPDLRVGADVSVCFAAADAWIMAPGETP